MIRTTRRDVLIGAAGLTLAGGIASSLSSASERSGLSVGLQLYTLSKELRRDLHGTLRAVAKIGFRDVELAEDFGLSAPALRTALKDAGLACASGHFSAHTLVENLDERIAYARELGLRHMVCPGLSVADPRRFEPAPGEDADEKHNAVLSAFTASDWQWNADFFNRVGERVRQAGMSFAFHNHVAEFKRIGTTTGYDELLRLTDPERVSMQLDCGWVTVAGLDPVAYLNKYPRRFTLLHLKDVDRASAGTGSTSPQFTEAGAGAVDWKRVLRAADTAGIRYGYVEMEAPFKLDPLASAQQSLKYLQTLR